MKKLLTLMVFGLAFGIAQMSSAATLVDVPQGHWAADAVQKLTDAGLIQGYPDSTFKGDRPMTRYEYALIVSRLLDLIDRTYCTKTECKVAPVQSDQGTKTGDTGGPVVVTPDGGNVTPAGGQTISLADLEQIRDIVKKLAAEFKDELAALKVQVDEQGKRIDKIEADVKASRIGNVSVSGSIRQRLDAPNSEVEKRGTLTANQVLQGQLNLLYNTDYGNAGVDAGYELYSYLQFTGKAGDNVDFLLSFDKLFTKAKANNAADDGALLLNNGYVSMDFSKTVRELDSLKLKSGYQSFTFGPYGLTADCSGRDHMPSIRLDLSKDIVSLTGVAGLIGNSGLVGPVAAVPEAKDAYAAVRIGLKLPFANLGVNFLGNGYVNEKAWGADAVIPLLKDSPFLTQLKGEYLTVTDDKNGMAIGSAVKDSSLIVGVDVYKNNKSSLTFSYADIPAVVAMSGVDVNPFTEYDTKCPMGLDVSPVDCFSYEKPDSLFVAGFQGLGLQASYRILGDVELGAKGIIGNFAGGSFCAYSDATGKCLKTINLDGINYPGYGALSVTKPINESSKFRVEYMQQGKDPVLLNRIRGELVINF